MLTCSDCSSVGPSHSQLESCKSDAAGHVSNALWEGFDVFLHLLVPTLNRV